MYALDNVVQNSDKPNPALQLTLIVNDPIACAELLARAEGRERTQFATTALSIGILCLREAVARVDVESLQEAGRTLLSEARELISSRGNDLMSQVSAVLREHFDPHSGLLPTRIEAFVKEGGQLRVLFQPILVATTHL